MSDDLEPTTRLDERTPLVDPGSTPRFAKRGESRREKPVVDRQPLGPMRGQVTVTPIRRESDGEVWFEVGAAWGPNADGSDVAGLFGWPTHRVQDIAAVAKLDEARAIAARAEDRLKASAGSDPHAGEGPALSLEAIARANGIALIDHSGFRRY